ncbi:palmitoyltransferase ZDHHC20-A-like [Xenopus laevis]|uniref:Palmitoyltransferase n=1 Tax=Xenopus laevis TaxID=8355 RepID=A0A8J1MZR1_XENLA|nr:palmitoyltransferase ZDHHC20-A-like [Xenopus laevis]
MEKQEENCKIDIEEEEKMDKEDMYSCRRRISRVMITLIIGLLATCYYIFVVELCIFTVPSQELKATFLVIFHILFLLCMWSYLRVVITPPAVPPETFRLSESDKQLYLSEERPEVQEQILSRAAKNLPLYYNVDSKTPIKYCRKCQFIKPDRCHHCTVCDICILKLDHHCVFLNNCVGFSNYKFFLLFLLYVPLLLIFTSAVSLYCSILFWTDQLPNMDSKGSAIALFCMSTFSCIIFCYRYIYDHYSLVVTNETLLEFNEGLHCEYNPYDLGYRKNWRQVFGNKKRYWFIPIFSSLGDGSSFPLGDATEDIEKNGTIDCQTPK